MTKDEYKDQNPIGAWVAGRGVVLHGGGKRRTTNQCPISKHKAGHLCVTVDEGVNLWKCNDCGQGGDIFSWQAFEEGKSPGEIITKLCGNGHAPRIPVSEKHAAPSESNIRKIYSYCDANGIDEYQVVRYEPKDFRQRHMVGGKWVWNMQGVTRILYQLPKVMASETVVVCEGEKDADTVTSLGWVATTNVGGGTNWLDSYSETLTGKDVIICPDNDKKGQEHLEVVLSSIQRKAKTVRCLKIPKQFKDVTDWLGEDATTENRERFSALIETTPALIKGVHIPIDTLPEAELKYVKHLRDLKNHEFNLGRWMPGLRECRLMSGELATIIAATGVGKTYALVNIALAAKPMPTVLFEMELTTELLYQRCMSIQMQWGEKQIQAAYGANELLGSDGLAAMNHCHLCCESGLTVEQIERHINNAELKIGTRPKLVLIDYIQLIQGPNKSRFDNISDAAEQLKVLAKTARVIIVMSSQMSRKVNPEEREVTLHDAKQSGSIENSSGLVLGMWRPDPDNKNAIKLRVLKNTKGEGGKLIDCFYKPGLNGAFTGKIAEQSNIDGNESEPETRSPIND